MTCASRAEDHAWLTFTVSDTGIGIEKSKIDQIFAPFAQADGSISRNYGGTGLGLAICTRLSEMFGGRLTVASRPGEGSSFSFDARFELSAEQEKPRQLPQSMVIVEPHEPSRIGLTELLSYWGVSCESASSARSAEVRAGLSLVDAAEEADLVNFGAPPRWVLYSSLDSARDVQRRFTLKPASYSEILELLSESLQKPSSSQAAAATRPESLQILVAEDNRVNQRLVRALLEDDGHTVTVVGDGSAAVEVASAQMFDVVLMDVQMPGTDGLEATRQLRADAVRARSGGLLPIIALTAHALPSDRERCLDAGMNEYVAKPIRRAELSAAIERVVRLGCVQGAEAAESERVLANLR